MSTVASGKKEIIFESVKSIVDHYLPVIEGNKRKKTGTEVEMFFLDVNGNALSLENGQLAFERFYQELNNFYPEYIYEDTPYGRKIVGINIPDLGTITAEIGHQIEFSATVSDTIDHVLEKNTVFYETAKKVAKKIGHTAQFKGYVDNYGATTKGSYRSRSQKWLAYFKNRYSDKEPSKDKTVFVGEALTATAATQITLDSGGTNFHEYVQALLIMEPLLSIHFSNSKRAEVANRLPAAHMNPMIGAWGAKDPREALTAIVERLMDVEVPMHLDKGGEYNLLLTNSDEAPFTVKNYMKGSMLTEHMLQNAGSFFFARPAFKNFLMGLLEMRGVDCLESPEKIAELAERVINIIYNDDARRALLKDYKDFTKEQILELHSLLPTVGREGALKASVAGKSVKAMIDDLIARSQPAMTPGSRPANGAKPAATP